MEDHSPLTHACLYSEFPLSYPGGGERLIKMIYDYLEEHGVETQIIENINLRLDGVILSEKVIKIPSMRVYPEKFVRYGVPKILYQDLPMVDHMDSRPNYVSLIFLRRSPPKKILRELSQKGIKVIFCMHGIAIEKFRFAHPMIIAHQLLMRIQLRSLAKYSKGHIFVQTLTKQMKSYLVDHGADQNNVFLIENEFETPLLEVRRNDNSFNILFIGRIENLSKGIRRLKKLCYLIAKNLPEVKINIVGSGKDSKILGKLPSNTLYLAKVDDDEKFRLIQSSNLGIITSNLEPFPLVFLEFLSSGLPVVTTPASGPAYIASKDMEFGIISSFKEDVILQDIEKYYDMWREDKTGYFNLKKRISSKARDMFKTEHMLELYKEKVINVSRRE
ncbi:MAG: glycosyltransferase family 4 protein [Thermoplasmatales archaeon]